MEKRSGQNREPIGTQTPRNNSRQTDLKNPADSKFLLFLLHGRSSFTPRFKMESLSKRIATTLFLSETCRRQQASLSVTRIRQHQVSGPISKNRRRI